MNTNAIFERVKQSVMNGTPHSLRVVKPSFSVRNTQTFTQLNKYLFRLLFYESILKHPINWYYRRQTAEEREQERQAATKYFLSMQLGSLPPPPPPPPPAPTTPTAPNVHPLHPMHAGHQVHPSLAAAAAAAVAAAAGGPQPSPGILEAKDDPSAISALESLRPWTSANLQTSA